MTLPICETTDSISGEADDDSWAFKNVEYDKIVAVGGGVHYDYKIFKKRIILKLSLTNLNLTQLK